MQALEVELCDVGFSYPESKRIVLHDLNLHIKPGERILISGTNGSGKSTLIHVMAGLYDIHQGHILYQGLNVQSYQKDSLRSIVGGCLTDEQLFAGTLSENISLQRPGDKKRY